jgi:hypothetical protein
MGVLKSVNGKIVGILTVNLWKVFWNDKQYFFPHASRYIFSVLTTDGVTEIEWITTHDIPHQRHLGMGVNGTAYNLTEYTYFRRYHILKDL